MLPRAMKADLYSMPSEMPMPMFSCYFGNFSYEDACLVQKALISRVYALIRLKAISCEFKSFSGPLSINYHCRKHFHAYIHGIAHTAPTMQTPHYYHAELPEEIID